MSTDDNNDEAPDRDVVATPAGVLVTGASGYVGGRLVPALLDRGHRARCVVRNPRKLDPAPWSERVDVVQADIAGDLSAAMTGIDVAVFLVHSIGDGIDWVARERAVAENFRRAAEAAGVRRLVYLGGLGEDDSDISVHLRSRHDVGTVLAGGSIETVELRAAVVIGPGSASFETLRYLTEVLPVMVAPKWVDARFQPISIGDVLRYLVSVIEAPGSLAGVVATDPHRTWQTVCRVGGEQGWYRGEFLWKLRGLVDQLAGGPGLRRGRRHPDRLSVGEPVDFWRVEDLETDRRLVLVAEMLLPGKAWLQWAVEPVSAGTLLVQTTRFRPRGLFGRAYWYLVAPFHGLVFPGLVKGIARDAVDQ